MRKIDLNEMMQLMSMGAIDCNPKEVPLLDGLNSCLQQATESLTSNGECCKSDSDPLPNVGQVKECWRDYEALCEVAYYDSRYYERLYVVTNEKFEFVPVGNGAIIPQPHELLHMVNTKHKITDLTKEEKDQLQLLKSRKRAMDGACCHTRKQLDNQLKDTYRGLVDSLTEKSPLVISLKKAEDKDTLYFYLDNVHLKTL
tara:strand:+ start:197 stop:796 length:600 start_codon:yes stop_codon:yes gene_type:complete